MWGQVAQCDNSEVSGFQVHGLEPGCWVSEGCFQLRLEFSVTYVMLCCEVGRFFEVL